MAYTGNRLEANVSPVCEVEDPTCSQWILWMLEHFCTFDLWVLTSCIFLIYLCHKAPRTFEPFSSQMHLLNNQSLQRICPCKKIHILVFNFKLMIITCKQKEFFQRDAWPPWMKTIYHLNHTKTLLSSSLVSMLFLISFAVCQECTAWIVCTLNNISGLYCTYLSGQWFTRHWWKDHSSFEMKPLALCTTRMDFCCDCTEHPL